MATAFHYAASLPGLPSKDNQTPMDPGRHGTQEDAAVPAQGNRAQNREDEVNQLPIFTESTNKPTLCALCGRPLKDHQSVNRQMGPKCWERVLTVARGMRDEVRNPWQGKKK